MDGPHVQTGRNSLRGCLVMLVLMSAGLLILGGLWMIFINSQCTNAGQNWLPDYPNAEVVSSDYTFINLYGIGESERVLYTEDDLRTVENWYRQSNRRNGTAGASRGGATLRWEATEAEGGGTQIRLTSSCARSLDLSPLGIGYVSRTP